MHSLIVYTRPNGSQFVTLYPFRVPTEIHLSNQPRPPLICHQLPTARLQHTHEKSWLKLANSMFEFALSTMAARYHRQRRQQLK